MPDVRNTPCIENPQVINASAPFSNFDFIENNFGPNLSPLQRIFSQARVFGYKTLILEKIRSVGFSKEDDLELKEAGFEQPDDLLIRLSFFVPEFNDLKILKDQVDSNFFGYMILKKVPLPDKSGYRWIVF